MKLEKLEAVHTHTHTHTHGYRLKDKKGITLIALIITIIVLLILAGISISAISGEDGMISRAGTAKEKSRAGEIKDIVGLTIDNNKIAEVQGESVTTKEALINQLVEKELLTDEEEKLLDNQDIITIEGVTIDFTELEDDGFDYLGRKYYFDGLGYTIFTKGEDMILYDYEDNVLGQIPAACMTYNAKFVTISGTGDYDGNYRFSEDDHYIYFINDTEENLIGFEDGYCTHEHWRWFYDENYNKILTSSISDVSELNDYTLRCEICLEELEFLQIGNYLYLYNSVMEPQRYNGETINGASVDIWKGKFDGWIAVPFDLKNTDGMLTSVNGEPIKMVWFYDNMYVPKTVQYIATYYSVNFANEENVSYLITYEGTIEEFKKINHGHSERNFVEDVVSECSKDSSILSFTVKCSDGDLIIK